MYHQTHNRYTIT